MNRRWCRIKIDHTCLNPKIGLNEIIPNRKPPATILTFRYLYPRTYSFITKKTCILHYILPNLSCGNADVFFREMHRGRLFILSRPVPRHALQVANGDTTTSGLLTIAHRHIHEHHCGYIRLLSITMKNYCILTHLITTILSIVLFTISRIIATKFVSVVSFIVISRVITFLKTHYNFGQDDEDIV